MEVDRFAQDVDMTDKGRLDIEDAAEEATSADLEESEEGGDGVCAVKISCTYGLLALSASSRCSMPASTP